MDKKNHIECSVVDCYYHAEGKICKANRVVIAPYDAHSSSETGCETFKPQQ